MFGLEVDTRIKLSAKSAQRPLHCDIEHILSCCMGRCCKGDAFWPSKASTVVVDGLRQCEYLTEKGCKLPDNEKPLTCLLYPFVLNKHNTLIIHFRAISICKGNIQDPEAPMAIEAMRKQFIELFGKRTYETMLKKTKAGIDYWFEPGKKFFKQVEEEERLAVEARRFKKRKY